LGVVVVVPVALEVAVEEELLELGRKILLFAFWSFDVWRRMPLEELDFEKEELKKR